MSNNLVDDSKEKRCELCGSNMTYIAVTKMELVIQNGIAILSKKIVHYAEDVTDTSYTKRLSLRFMFVGVSV